MNKLHKGVLCQQLPHPRITCTYNMYMYNHFNPVIYVFVLHVH